MADNVILVVEDEPDVMDIITSTVERPGRRVVTAQDGIEALGALRSACPDLVLLDIRLPRLDGFGVLRAIRGHQKLKGTPVVLLSAHGQAADKARGKEEGADDYIVKPFEPEHLERVVARLLKEGR